MKVTPEHQQILMHAIYRSMQGMETLEEYRAHGLTAKRWRWDLLWRAQRVGYISKTFVVDELYPYCNDDHIDTVLRHRPHPV
jgi:hypothetical protein